VSQGAQSVEYTLPPLRSYQAEAIQKLRREIAASKRRIMLSSATGSGKSRIMLEMAMSAARKGKRVVVMCDRIQLVQQMSEHMHAAGVEHGIIQSSNSRAEYLPVVVASIQTVAKRGLPDGTDLLLIDEAHGAAGRIELRNIIERAMKAPKAAVIGFSATPWSRGLAKHYDSLGGPLFESLVTTVALPELIEQGFLVDCDVYAPCDPDLSQVKVTAGDYNERQLGEAMNKTPLIADIVETWVKLAYGLPTVCFATNIAHSEALCAKFRAAGVAAEHISCHTDDDERKEILKRVASGQTKVICNAMLLTTGWDFPACRCMILARPTKSLVTFVQMVGRVLRSHPGKDIATVLDHSGTCLRLGFPTDDRSDIPMCDGKPKAGASEKRDKPEALPKACPNCHYLKPAKVHKCPACSFEPKKPSNVEVIDGDLMLVKGKKRSAQEAALEKRFGTKQEVYSMLLAYASDHGMKTGFAAHKYRAIFGVWPKGLSEAKKETSLDLQRWIVSERIRWAKTARQGAANASV